MRTRPARVAPWLAPALAALHAGANAAPITCPPVMVETPVVSSLLPGWEVDVRAGRRTLSDAAIHLSRGSDRADLAPDFTHLSGRQETATWLLPARDDAVYWVACSYGSTTALLLQKVPESARRCVATYDVLKSGRRLNVRPMQCD